MQLSALIQVHQPLKKLLVFAALLLIAMCNNSTAQTCQAYTYPNNIGMLSATITTSVGTGNYYIANNVEISSAIDFEDAEILMAPGTSITIHNGGILHIKGSHLFSCADMWLGIVVETGGRLIIDEGSNHDNSLIEDADVAVSLYGYYYDLAGLGGAEALTVNNAIFNRNRIGISFAGSRNYYRITPSPNYPVSIKNSIFTCRDIPFVAGSTDWIRYEDFKNTTLTIATTYPNTPNSLSSPYIDETAYASNNGNAYLKLSSSPLTKSENGIFIGGGYHYYGTYKIGEPTNARFTNNVVIFDNQTIGIELNSMDATINNCTFQNTRDANPNPETYGIFAHHYDEEDHFIATTAPALTPHNAFFDCKYAIKVDYFTHATLDDNDIRSSKTDDLGKVDDGLEGITITTTSFLWDHYNTTILARNNQIANIANGITLKFNDWAWHATGTPPNPSGVIHPLGSSIEVNNNHISSGNDLGFVTPNAAYFCDQAINMEVVVPTYVYPTLVPPLRCNGNVLNLVSNGIRLSNWDGKDTRVLNNYIALNNDPNNLSTTIRGIALEGNQPQNPMGNYVYANTIVTTVDDATKFTAGIYVNNGTGFTIRCNNTSGIQAHHLYNGYLQPTNFFNNDISTVVIAPPFLAITTDNKGLLLNAGSDIGPQGNGSAASDNKWTNANGRFWGYNNNFKTFAAGSNVTNSPLYVQQSVANYDPQDAPPLVYNGAIFSPLTYDFSNGSLQNGAANNLGCPYITARYSTVTIGERDYTYIIDDSTLHVPIAEDVIPVDNNEGRQMAAAEQLANGYNANSNLTEPQLRLYVAQMQLYHYLQSPSNPWQSKSNTLKQFVANAKTKGFGTIDSIAKNIALNKLTLAQQQLTSWMPTNRVEQNYAQFFNWTILRRQKQPIDLAEVEQLAIQCPQTDGNIVFAAQNLYNAITNKHKLFVTNCDYKTASTSSKQAKQLPITVLNATDNIKIYPNPTSDVVNITGKDLKKIELLDVYGKVLATKIMDFSTITMPLSRFSKGLYFIRITNNDNSIIIKKIVKF